MSKLLLLLSFLSLVLLSVGTVFWPHSHVFLLAADGVGYEIIRIILAVILFAQLVTHPPRHIVFRSLAGAISVIIGGWTAQATLNGQMNFLDIFVFLGAAAAIAVTALEVQPREEQFAAGANEKNPLIA